MKGEPARQVGRLGAMKGEPAREREVERTRRERQEFEDVVCNAVECGSTQW